MNRNLVRLLLLVLVAVLGWFSWAAWRAHGKLVTLDVQNADVRAVIRSIQWQTWEIIHTHKDVQGKITLNVRHMPLEEVLDMVAEQVAARATSVYPLYTTGKSLTALKKALRGEVNPAEHGWKALASRPMTPFGMFANNASAGNKLVTLQLQDKDLEFATLALGRFAQAQIVPEDGTLGQIKLNLQQAHIEDAVEQVAKQTHRKWTRLYAMQASPRFDRRPREQANAGDGDTNRPAFGPPSGFGFGGPGGPGGPGGFREPSPEQQEQMKKQFEASLATMTPEERESAEQGRQRMEEMRNLSPEDRQKRFEEMSRDPAFQQQRAEMQQRMQEQMMQGLKNSTPEQRQERNKWIGEMRKRREQQLQTPPGR